MDKKVCEHCKKEKNISEYYKPYFHWCKECTDKIKIKTQKKEDYVVPNYYVWFNQIRNG